jgi:hypothetical protein
MAGSLVWDENQEKAVDRVVAIAYAARNNELGAALLRVEALDAAALRKVNLLVVRRLNHKHRITRGFAGRMVLAVMQECLHPGCVYCGGKGETHREAEIITICTICNGSGLHRFTDGDRRAMIGGTYNKAAYEFALGLVRDSLRNVVAAANYRLTDEN